MFFEGDWCRGVIAYDAGLTGLTLAVQRLCSMRAPHAHGEDSECSAHEDDHTVRHTIVCRRCMTCGDWLKRNRLQWLNR